MVMKGDGPALQQGSHAVGWEQSTLFVRMLIVDESQHAR